MADDSDFSLAQDAVGLHLIMRHGLWGFKSKSTLRNPRRMLATPCAEPQHDMGVSKRDVSWWDGGWSAAAESSPNVVSPSMARASPAIRHPGPHGPVSAFAAAVSA